MQQHVQQKFAIGDAVKSGWRLFWPNILPMLLFAIIVWAVSALIQIPQQDAGGVAAFFLGLLSFIVGQLISIGWVKLALDITDGQGADARAIMSKFSLIVPYAIAAILFSVMVTIGLVLLIVPGIILAITFYFYSFHIVDTGETNPIQALRRSAEITKGSRWQLFLFALVLIGINLLGLLVLIVGVLFTSGISLLAIAYVYRRLSPVSPDFR